MAETSALFDEPDRIDLWTAFPPRLVQASQFHDGLRWLHVGEDGETFVALGHPDAGRIVEVARFRCGMWDNDIDPTTFEQTWARFLTHCPDHLAQHTDGCTWCELIQFDDEWWLDWSKPDGRPLDHNASTPGYFPVTIWEVIQ
ncbi:hypothetical protein Lesp02_70330 [Lentzea sp. NBRC 105346]|uniref:hypothetical protein n=1 Tax=Lentzea sp. NBRC 105346 TaxID=3032205 RepID=UPI0024A57B1A|nr:hypothetical protein [Lentzea sp. NBRC 105346]GLZ34846.1 hypothetical protein Lesp02_70330 [Lentzea sp. NBRC 105346]